MEMIVVALGVVAILLPPWRWASGYSPRWPWRRFFHYGASVASDSNALA